MAIRLNIGTLKDGGQVLDFISDSNEIGLDKSLIKDKIHISIEIYKLPHQIDLKILVNFVLNLICDRCLEIFPKELKADFELVYIQKSERESSFDDGYVKSFSPFMKTIDITGDIREFILLTVPMKHLPPEKNDGSCSWCGKTKDYWKNYMKETEE